MRLSARQRYWLCTLADAPGGNPFVSLYGDGLYMPYSTDVRTFDALARRGLVAWINQQPQPSGMPLNGYRITAAGRAALGEPE